MISIIGGGLHFTTVEVRHTMPLTASGAKTEHEFGGGAAMVGRIPYVESPPDKITRTPNFLGVNHHGIPTLVSVDGLISY
jgi:hypothetical protein